MCRSLIAFYRHGGRARRGWAHFSDALTGDGISYHGADYGKLAYWELLEPHSEKYGFWRCTPLGVSFIEREVSVPSHSVIYDGTCLRVDGELVSILDALGKKFDYWELMREHPTSNQPQ